MKDRRGTKRMTALSDADLLLDSANTDELQDDWLARAMPASFLEEEDDNDESMTATGNKEAKAEDTSMVATPTPSESKKRVVFGSSKPGAGRSQHYEELFGTSRRDLYFPSGTASRVVPDVAAYERGTTELEQPATPSPPTSRWASIHAQTEAQDAESQESTLGTLDSLNVTEAKNRSEADYDAYISQQLLEAFVADANLGVVDVTPAEVIAAFDTADQSIIKAVASRMERKDDWLHHLFDTWKAIDVLHAKENAQVSFEDLEVHLYAPPGPRAAPMRDPDSDVDEDQKKVPPPTRFLAFVDDIHEVMQTSVLRYDSTGELPKWHQITQAARLLVNSDLFKSPDAHLHLEHLANIAAASIHSETTREPETKALRASSTMTRQAATMVSLVRQFVTDIQQSSQQARFVPLLIQQSQDKVLRPFDVGKTAAVLSQIGNLLALNRLPPNQVLQQVLNKLVLPPNIDLFGSLLLDKEKSKRFFRDLHTRFGTDQASGLTTRVTRGTRVSVGSAAVGAATQSEQKTSSLNGKSAKKQQGVKRKSPSSNVDTQSKAKRARKQ
jgi:hypothetical protein